MKQLLIAGGLYNLAFAVFHIFFWRIFHWKTQLSALDFLNRAIMQVLNLCLVFCFLIFSYISLFHVSELLTTGLGHILLAGMALFWLFRAVEQIVFFRLRHWNSVVFLLLFFCGAILYTIPLLTAVT